MSDKSKSDSRRKTLLIISLILVVVLVSSLCTYKFLVVDNGSVRVKSASELRDAVNKAEVGVPINIVLTNDISLGPALTIPAGADITLTSTTGGKGFFRLIGLDGQNVITVEDGGRLTLNGIIVSHEIGATGYGIGVYGGTFIMVNGEISGNTGEGLGGGVWNSGTFIMFGGTIADNTAAVGGGVANEGTFVMSGGTITNNQAIYSNSVIIHGDRNGNGGGVYNGGTFELSGGAISGNTAITTSGLGGGVYHVWGSFVMTGGTISGNTAHEGGGVYYIRDTFNRSGGEISGNTADKDNDESKNIK